MKRAVACTCMAACAFYLASSTRAMADAATYNYVCQVPFTETSVSIKFGENGDVGTTSDGGWQDDRPYTHFYTNVYLWTPDDLRASAVDTDCWVVLAFQAPKHYWFRTVGLTASTYINEADPDMYLASPKTYYYEQSFWYTTNSYTGAAAPVKTSEFTYMRNMQLGTGGASPITRSHTLGSVAAPLHAETIYIATFMRRPSGTAHSDLISKYQTYTFTLDLMPRKGTMIKIY